MSPALAQREVALAGIALLAAVVALAISSVGDSSNGSPALPQPVPVAGGGWYHALAGVRRGSYGTRTACGQVLRPTTIGVGDPVLPCGAKIFVGYGDTEVLTQVIDRGPTTPGRRFNLTEPLAERLGLRGVQPVRWAFAR